MDLTNEVSAVFIRNQSLQGGLQPYVTSFRGSGILDQVAYHILVESKSSEPDSACWAAATSLARSLTDSRMVSLTSALEKAFRKCHSDLVALNENSDVASRVGVSATCLAFRGTDLYLGHAGDSLLYMRDEKGVRQLLAAKSPSPKFGLGIDGSEPSVSMERHILIGQESFLLCSESLKDAVSYDGLDAVMSSSHTESINKLTLIMGNADFFVALLATTRR